MKAKMASDVLIRLNNIDRVLELLGEAIDIFWSNDVRRPSRLYLTLKPNGTLTIRYTMKGVRLSSSVILTEIRASPRKWKSKVLYISKCSLARQFEDELVDLVASREWGSKEDDRFRVRLEVEK